MYNNSKASAIYSNIQAFLYCFGHGIFGIFLLYMGNFLLSKLWQAECHLLMSKIREFGTDVNSTCLPKRELPVALVPVIPVLISVMLFW